MKEKWAIINELRLNLPKGDKVRLKIPLTYEYKESLCFSVEISIFIN
jgi:hypothetical protein